MIYPKEPHSHVISSTNQPNLTLLNTVAVKFDNFNEGTRIVTRSSKSYRRKICRRKLFVGENYSLGKIIRRGKLFVGENYSSGKIIRRGKLFVRVNYSSGKIIRQGKLFVREKLFVGKNHSSGKIIRREKSFVGKNHSSGKIIRRGTFSSAKMPSLFPEKISTDKVSANFRKQRQIR